MADGISTIADMGVHHDPTPVVRITDASGKVLYALDPKDQGHRVIPANAAFIITEITSNDANRQSEFGANGPLTLPGRRVSAKTGTAEYFVDTFNGSPIAVRTFIASRTFVSTSFAFMSPSWIVTAFLNRGHGGPVGHAGHVRR